MSRDGFSLKSNKFMIYAHIKRGDKLRKSTELQNQSFQWDYEFLFEKIMYLRLFLKHQFKKRMLM